MQQMQRERQMTVQQQQEQHVPTLSLVKDMIKSFIGKSEQWEWGRYMFTFISVFYGYKSNQRFTSRASFTCSIFKIILQL